MPPSIYYVAPGLIILLWGSYYFQMSPYKKRFVGGLIGEPFHDPSSDFEDEPIEDEPFGEELTYLVVESGQKKFVEFFEAQMAYNKKHSQTFDLKGSIPATLVDICGLAVGIVRDPYYQLEARDDIESKVRQTDRFMTTYMDDTGELEEIDEFSAAEPPGMLLESYHAIWERLEQIGVIAKQETY